MTSGYFGCPNAAFGSFSKRDLANSDRCGFEVESVVCGDERTGLPCIDKVCTPEKRISCQVDADCPAGLSCYVGDDGGVCNPTTPVACSAKSECDTIGTLPLKDPTDPSKGNQEWKCHAMNCGDALNGFACESHDTCLATCGYREYECDDEFRDHLFATCYALEGQEKDLCQDLCLTFATAYADAQDPVFQDDDGTWTAFDYGQQADNCRCCTNLVADLDLGSKADEYASSICGDGICNPETESCLKRSCPTDCGLCAEGDFCASDTDCPGLACLGGRCGKFPALTPCDSDSQCRSDTCGILGFCVDVCGDGFCDGTEVCSGNNLPPFACNQDCGKCAAGKMCLLNSDCQSDICNFGTCISAGVLPDGQVCTDNDACQSGICNFGICIGAPQPAGLPCTTDGACISGNCVGVCVQSCGDGSCDGTELCGAADQGLACNTDCGDLRQRRDLRGRRGLHERSLHGRLLRGDRSPRRQRVRLQRPVHQRALQRRHLPAARQRRQRAALHRQQRLQQRHLQPGPLHRGSAERRIGLQHRPGLLQRQLQRLLRAGLRRQPVRRHRALWRQQLGAQVRDRLRHLPQRLPLHQRERLLEWLLCRADLRESPALVWRRQLQRRRDLRQQQLRPGVQPRLRQVPQRHALHLERRLQQRSL